MDWVCFKEYFGNISDLAQGIGAIAALIGVVIAYIQLRKENRKRDEEIRHLTEQTSELKNLYKLQETTRKNNIKPIIDASGCCSSASDGYTYYLINNGRRAYDFSGKILEQTEGFIISDLTLPTKYLDSGRQIMIHITTADKKYGIDKLKGTAFKFLFHFYDEDGNLYKSETSIIDGKHEIVNTKLINH